MLPFFDAPETSWAPGTPGTVTTRKDTNPSALPGRTNSWLLSNSSRSHTIPATNDTCTFFPLFFGRSTQNVVELSMRFMSKPVQFQNSSGCFVCRSYYSCDYFRDKSFRTAQDRTHGSQIGFPFFPFTSSGNPAFFVCVWQKCNTA